MSEGDVDRDHRLTTCTPQVKKRRPTEETAFLRLGVRPADRTALQKYRGTVDSEGYGSQIWADQHDIIFLVARACTTYLKNYVQIWV